MAGAAPSRYHEAQFYHRYTEVLAVVVYDKLYKYTSIAMVSGMKEVCPIWRALGRDKATALPVLHAFTGDTVW